MYIAFNNQLLPNDKKISLRDFDKIKITWDKEYGQYYTLMMYDIDTPSKANPVNSPFMHYLIVNSDKIIISMMPPSPPPMSGPHRYYIELYGQKDIIETGQTQRVNFQVAQFVAKNNLAFMERQIIIADPTTNIFYKIK